MNEAASVFIHAAGLDPEGQQEPTCAYCGKKASELAECRIAAEQEGTTPAFEAREDGTYNPRTNRFACTDCYIKIGMPDQRDSRDGKQWKAP